jgi:hypothetical protein
MATTKQIVKTIRKPKRTRQEIIADKRKKIDEK